MGNLTLIDYKFIWFIHKFADLYNLSMYGLDNSKIFFKYPLFFEYFNATRMPIKNVPFITYL